MIAVAFSLEGALVRGDSKGETRRVLGALDELSMPLAAFGNGSSASVESAARAIGFAGLVLASEEAGAELPSIRAFAAITSACSLPADRIWFVSAWDQQLRMARALGFETIFAGESLAVVLDAIGEPYTRALLELRYTMRTTLQWRAGYTIEALDENALDPSVEHERS